MSERVCARCASPSGASEIRLWHNSSDRLYLLCIRCVEAFFAWTGCHTSSPGTPPGQAPSVEHTKGTLQGTDGEASGGGPGGAGSGAGSETPVARGLARPARVAAAIGQISDFLDVLDGDEHPDDEQRWAAREALQVLRSVVEREGGMGADVPAPAVPMEGEPGPVVQLGPGRASIAQRGDGVAVDNPDEQINRLADYLYVTHAFDPDKPVVDTAMSIMESLVRSLLAKGRPSTWLPPNAIDTNAPSEDE